MINRGVIFLKVLLLGRGVANDGVELLLKKEAIEYYYCNPDEVLSFDYDLVVKAPGIPYDHSIIRKISKLKIKIVADIEIAMILRKKFYIGVTGSNGKTTTVSLISHILNQKYKVITCGNIGYSVCRALVENEDVDIFVVELSSFQLENAHIDLNISAILNINPCHQDHHKNFKDYINSKANICLNQSSRHSVVYNYDDKQIRTFIKDSEANKIAFSSNSPLCKCYIRNKYLYYGKKKILKIEEYANKEFLLSDIMAAISVVMQVDGITKRLIKKALKSFKEVDFRMTKVNDYIYNDAKSTNPYSTIAALKCFDKVALICGGYDRKENLACLNDYLGKLKLVYTYGESKEKVASYMKKHNVNVLTFDNLEASLIMALNNHKDEVILFSPMFASFDSFSNYIERGNYFNELIKKHLK